MSKFLGLDGLMPLRLRLFLDQRRQQADAQVQINRWLASIGLTPREHTIAQLILEHRSYQDIGQRCKVSPRTVQFHASNIFHKAHVARRGDFERAATAQGASGANQKVAAPGSTPLLGTSTPTQAPEGSPARTALMRQR